MLQILQKTPLAKSLLMKLQTRAHTDLNVYSSHTYADKAYTIICRKLLDYIEKPDKTNPVVQLCGELGQKYNVIDADSNREWYSSQY